MTLLQRLNRYLIIELYNFYPPKKVYKMVHVVSVCSDIFKMASSTASMENVFRQRLAEIRQNGKSNSTFSKEQYFTVIDDLKNAMQQTGTKSKKQYYLFTRYEINILLQVNIYCIYNKFMCLL